MRKTTIILILAMMASLCAAAQGCDTVQLPYSSNFTQCWTAVGGATISDSCHATLATRGDRLVSPWFEAGSGSVYVGITTSNDHEEYYAGQPVVNIIIERYDYSVVPDTAGFYGIDYEMNTDFECTDGLYRIVIEYVGDDTMPDLTLTDVSLYKYPISVSLSGVPDTAYVGDTITALLHVSLPDGEELDSDGSVGLFLHEFISEYRVWQGNMIGLFPEFFNYINSNIIDIVAHTDSSATIVWRRANNYKISWEVYVPDVYNGYDVTASPVWSQSKDICVLNRNGIRGVQANSISVSAEGCNITVKGAMGEPVVLFDIMGHQIAQKIDSNDIEAFKVPSAGVYIVKVGNLPARKIVVVR